MRDVVVIGGGIAGVSAGYFCARRGLAVTLVEAEAQLAYHTTGRSAAVFRENLGAGPVRPLTRASRPFFESPPEGLFDAPVFSPRGSVAIAREDQLPTLEQLIADGEEMGCDVRQLTPAEAAELVPVIRPDRLAAAIYEPDDVDMDVAAIHQAFVRGMRRHGAEIRTSAPVTALTPDGSGWRIRAGDDELTARVVVNAAGAWCDEVASLAGVATVGLQPMRRTAFMVPGDEAWRDWPMVHDANHDFYFKPDGPQLLCSLAEEEPCHPCDARPREIDVALAIERINQATTLGIRTVRSQWTGLRSFVADRAMVIGFEPGVDGFFWLAGQGGTGIQTSPAAGMLTAGLICDGEPPAELVEVGLDLTQLLPDRLR